MKLHVYSDLHLEFKGAGNVTFWQAVAGLAQQDPGAVCVLAGDIVNWRQQYEAPKALEHFRGLYREVIYVPGNHDSAKMAIHDSNARVLKYAAELGFHYLRPGHEVTIDGQRFLGGTLWYPNPNLPDLDWFYDRQVHPSLEPAYAHNAEFINKVCREMTHADIIISHHLPHPRSISSQWVTSPVNCYFLSDQTHWIETRWPKLWIHGHTHDGKDYVVRPEDKSLWTQEPDWFTRVYCNPLGYLGEDGNPYFWERVRLDC